MNKIDLEKQVGFLTAISYFNLGNFYRDREFAESDKLTEEEVVKVWDFAMSNEDTPYFFLVPTIQRTIDAYREAKALIPDAPLIEPGPMSPEPNWKVTEFEETLANGNKYKEGAISYILQYALGQRPKKPGESNPLPEKIANLIKSQR